jgi:hypothetical protein
MKPDTFQAFALFQVGSSYKKLKWLHQCAALELF